VFTVWSRFAEGPSLSREDVADAIQVLGWHARPVSDSGAERLYANSAGRRLRVHAAREEAQSRRDDPRARPVPLCHQDRRLPVSGQIARRCWRRVAPQEVPALEVVHSQSGGWPTTFPTRRLSSSLAIGGAYGGQRALREDLEGLGRFFVRLRPSPAGTLRPQNFGAENDAIAAREVWGQRTYLVTRFHVRASATVRAVDTGVGTGG
jgi:hypothetical protein